MTKVKIICTDKDIEDLENKINTFISSYPALEEVVDIKELQGFNCSAVLITYKEAKA